jgi:hypothetical protein
VGLTSQSVSPANESYMGYNIAYIVLIALILYVVYDLWMWD